MYATFLDFYCDRVVPKYLCGARYHLYIRLIIEQSRANLYDYDPVEVGGVLLLVRTRRSNWTMTFST